MYMYVLRFGNGLWVLCVFVVLVTSWPAVQAVFESTKMRVKATFEFHSYDGSGALLNTPHASRSGDNTSIERWRRLHKKKIDR